MKRNLAILVLTGLLFLSGCKDKKDIWNPHQIPIRRVLQHNKEVGFLSTKQTIDLIGRPSGTSVSLEYNKYFSKILESDKIVTDIDTGDFNKDGTTDFTLYYAVYSKLNNERIGTETETFLSKNNTFNYESKR